MTDSDPMSAVDLVSRILGHLQRSCNATQDDFALAGPAK